jgi:hypothetical protein
MKNVTSISRVTNTQLNSLSDAPTRYEQRFGALPFWLDEVPTNYAQALLKQALQRGAPLTAADDFH